MITIVAIAVPSFFATVRWIAYLKFLARRDKDSLRETADAIRAYRAGHMADLAEGLAAMIFGSRQSDGRNRSR